MTPKEFLESAGGRGRRRMDLRLANPPNVRQPAWRPIPPVGPGVFVKGLGFDGSSIRGRREFRRSEVMDVQRPTAAAMVPSITLNCRIDEMIARGQTRFPGDLRLTGDVHRGVGAGL